MSTNSLGTPSSSARPKVPNMSTGDRSRSRTRVGGPPLRIITEAPEPSSSDLSKLVNLGESLLVEMRDVKCLLQNPPSANAAPAAVPTKATKAETPKDDYHPFRYDDVFWKVDESLWDGWWRHRCEQWATPGHHGGKRHQNFLKSLA